MSVNTAMWLNNGKQFFKGFKIIFPYAQSPTVEVTPLFIKWMTSQAYSSIPLQIWKQPNRIKCSDQFKVNKRDTDCFEHLYVKNTNLLVNVNVSRCQNFLIDLRFFMIFTEGRGGVTELYRMGQGWYENNIHEEWN